MGEKESIRTFPADLLAGVSVACVVVPQSLAYASLAGVPVECGLVSAAVAPFPAAVLASSRYLQTGPVALTCFLTASAIGNSLVHVVPGTAQYAATAAALAVVVGVFRLALGAVGAGKLVELIPKTVLDGFTLAAAWMIAVTQIPAIIGHSAAAGLPLQLGALSLLLTPWTWHMPSVLLSGVSVAILVFGTKLHRLMPSALLAVAAGCAATAMGYPIGETIGSIHPKDLFIHAPAFEHLVDLALPGFIIAIAGFSEAIAVGRRFAAEDNERWDASRELLAQGASNVACGLFGGIPVGASFSRSAMNRVLGARTRMAGALTGVAVLGFLFCGMNTLDLLPKSVLGGIVVASIAPLMLPTKDMAPVGWLTCALTIALSPRVEIGLAAGMAVAISMSTVKSLMEAGAKGPIKPKKMV